MMYTPNGEYVTFARQRRDRLIAGAAGVALGLAVAVLMFQLGAWA